MLNMEMTHALFVFRRHLCKEALSIATELVFAFNRTSDDNVWFKKQSNAFIEGNYPEIFLSYLSR